MRLWHYALIPVLPRQQLLGQYRECCAIAKLIFQEKGVNHMLVNKITDYPAWMWMHYQTLVTNEMRKRGYSVYAYSEITLNENTMKAEEEGYFADDDSFPFDLNDLFPGWHTDRYLRQCYFNLQEKYDCGGITEDEWKAIEDFVDCKNVMMYYY